MAIFCWAGIGKKGVLLHEQLGTRGWRFPASEFGREGLPEIGFPVSHRGACRGWTRPAGRRRRKSVVAWPVRWLNLLPGDWGYSATDFDSRNGRN